MKARKEVTIAIVIGLLVGLVVVGGIIRAQSALKNVTPPDLGSVIRRSSPSPSPSNNELFLTLTTEDNQVVDTNTITLTGSTLPDTYIVILGEAGEYIIVPNDLGQFSQEVKLVAGANTIKITAWQKDGNKTESTLNVVYTEVEI